MTRFLLHHSHEAHECSAAFAAWKGFKSLLRGRTTIGSCLTGSHEIWWQLEAASEQDALDQLPRYVARRTAVVRVNEVRVP